MSAAGFALPAGQGEGFESCKFAATHNVGDTVKYVIDSVDATPELKTEYFSIVDGNTLQEVSSWDESDYIVGCIAVHTGEIRLIDNVVYKKA